MAIAPKLNPRLAGLTPSATVSINDRSNALRAAGRRIFKLGLGQSPFPVPEPVQAALRAHAGEKDYLPVMGLPALREAVADHHRRVDGIDCTAEDVLVGPGSKELLFLLQMAYDGELVVPSPSWVSYVPQARIIGHPLHVLPTRFEDGWLLTAETLERACELDEDQARLLILNYPSNPAGSTLDETRLRELAEVAERRNVLVLSDEIYGRLDHDGNHRSIVPMLPETAILSGGLSKWCGAGGWRLGVFVFPKQLHWLRDAMAAVATETFTSTAAPIQHAAIAAFTASEEIDAYVDDSRRVLRALGRACCKALRSSGARVVEPQGGFYLFADFTPVAESLHARGIVDAAGLCESLLEATGVAVLPGSSFGRPRRELSIRAAYVDFDGAGALAAVRALDGEPDHAFCQANCGDTLEAFERIASWVRGSN